MFRLLLTLLIALAVAAKVGLAAPAPEPEAKAKVPPELLKARCDAEERVGPYVARSGKMCLPASRAGLAGVPRQPLGY